MITWNRSQPAPDLLAQTTSSQDSNTEPELATAAAEGGKAFDLEVLKQLVSKGLAEWAAEEQQDVPAVLYELGPAFAATAAPAGEASVLSPQAAALSPQAAAATRESAAAAAEELTPVFQLHGCFPCCLAAGAQGAQELLLLLAPKPSPASTTADTAAPSASGPTSIGATVPALDEAAAALAPGAAARTPVEAGGGGVDTGPGRVVVYCSSGEVLMDEGLQLPQEAQMVGYVVCSLWYWCSVLLSLVVSTAAEQCVCNWEVLSNTAVCLFRR